MSIGFFDKNKTLSTQNRESPNNIPAKNVKQMANNIIQDSTMKVVNIAKQLLGFLL